MLLQKKEGSRSELNKQLGQDGGRPFFKNIWAAPEQDARSHDIIVETREGRLFRKKHNCAGTSSRASWKDSFGATRKGILLQKQLETSVVKFTSTRHFR